MKSKAFALISLFIFCLSLSAQSQERKITHLRDNIYRFQDNKHFSIFIVGNSGYVMTDPLNLEAAQWLKKEVVKRFGKKPVRYLIYSHNHPDHISGGQGLVDAGTQVIAHRRADNDMRRNQVSTVYPTLTFTDVLKFQFEGTEIELRYFGENNGAGSITVFIPEKKFLFGVDWVLVKRLPWKEMYNYDFEGMIESLERLLSLYDFDMVAPGHSVVGKKSDLKQFHNYLKDLRQEVLAGMKKGLSLKQMQDQISLKKYKHFAMYKEWRKMNIKGAYDQLTQLSGRYGQPK